MIEIGTIQKLRVSKIVDFGYYLEHNKEEILLPKKYAKEPLEVDDTIEVFLYTDSDDRAIATTLKPYGVRGEIVSLKVVDKNSFGIFLDLGIAKDLFMPTKTQHHYLINSFVCVLISTDRENRLIALSEFKNHLKNANDYAFKAFEEVDIIPFRKTPLGIECVINGKFLGLVFHNEIFEDLPLHLQKKAYIKKIHTNGKIDLILKKPQSGSKNDEVKILDFLKENGGIAHFHYDSNPQEIMKNFSMSKKAFKKALTSLLNQNKITLKAKDSIKLES